MGLGSGNGGGKRRLISTGSPFEKTAGYSRAVIDGDWCFVSGTTGYDYATMTMPESVEEQTRNCLSTIRATLLEGSFELADVVRAHYYVTSQSYVSRVFPILGEAFGDIRPAATMIVCQLNEPEMKIEIEVTALRRNRTGSYTGSLAQNRIAD
ncbi:RidA family protein [Nitratireductor indicus]|uniref:RidA family protein n=1 Tax=Nitratireductor indicus TaxID=721133 RepID=UPI002875BB93|nr:RidA family protein [Nitratireductor indicus]MDS1136953.1 RidA family protein [Nitratireductor indicus]